ncbi:MAG: hypothetical protein WBF04_02560 [Candidatus Sulfotelmatobacter sp.]
MKKDVLGESLSLYRLNNPECTEKEPISGVANFYQAKDTGKWHGQCMVSEELGGAPGSYADLPVTIKSAMFEEDRFVFLQLFMKHVFYPLLRDNLIAKFGEPTSRATEEVQNKMGARVASASLIWDNGVSSIHLSEYGGGLETLTLSFAMDDYMKAKPLSKPSKDM